MLLKKPGNGLRLPPRAPGGRAGALPGRPGKAQQGKAKQRIAKQSRAKRSTAKRSEA